MGEVRHHILPILFAAVLLLPTVNSLFGLWHFEPKDENRTITQFPIPDITFLDGYPSDFEEWYNNDFSFRAPLLRLFHDINVKTFGISPDPTRTIIGAGGQMFQGARERDIIEGRLQLTEIQLDSLEIIWADRMAFFAAKEIKCYWFIIPIKENVYTELLPREVIPNNRPRRAEQIAERLNARFPELVHDLQPALLLAKDTLELYFKLDNHWNFDAGAVATQEILKVVSRDFKHIRNVPFNTINWVDSNHQQGFHRTVLGDDATVDMYRYPISTASTARTVEKYGFPSIPRFPYPWDYENRYRIQGDTLAPRALIIRDSFTDFTRPFLVEAFSETVLIFDSWQFRANRHIVKTIKPDVIIYCTVEGFIEQHLEHEKQVREGRIKDD